MRFRGKWRRVGVGVAILAGVVAALYFIALPAYARKKVRATLQALGAVDPAFTLERVSLRGLRIFNLDLGPQSWLSAASVEVGYSPASLMGGRVSTIVVHAARWNVSMRDGRLELGPELRGAEPVASSLPFETLVVTNSMVALDWNGAKQELPLAGELNVRPAGGLQVDLRSEFEQRPIAIVGLVQPAEEAIAFDLDADWAERLSLSTDGHFARAGDSLPHRIDVTLDAAERAVTIAGRQMVVGSIHGRVGIELGDELSIEGIGGSIEIDALNVEGETIDDLALTFDSRVGAPGYQAAGRYREAAFTAEGDLNPLVDHLRGRSSDPFATEWQIALATPEALVQWLGARGVQLEAGPDEIAIQATTALSLPRAGVDGEWTIGIPALHAEVPGVTLRSGSAAASAADAALDLSVTARVSDGLVVVEALGESRVIANGLRIESEGTEFSAATANIAIDAVEGEPLARVTFPGASGGHAAGSPPEAAPGDGAAGAAGLAIRAALGIEVPASVSIQGGTVAAELPELAAAVQLAVASDSRPSIDGELTLKQANVTIPGAELGARNCSATIPFSFHDRLAARGGFSIGDFAWRGESIAGLLGSLRLEEGRLGIVAAGQPVKNATVHAEATIDFTGETTAIIATANARAFELADDARRLLRKIPAFHNAEVGGTFSLDAELASDGRAFSPRVTITGRNASLANEDWLLDVASASGAVTFVNFAPLATAPHQAIIIDRAAVGELDIEGGQVIFTLESPERLQIDQAQWSMGRKGSFFAGDFAVNPAAPIFTTTIDCAGADLAEWLPLLSGGRATGSGALSGSLLVHIDPAVYDAVQIEEGSLAARRPPGSITIDRIEAVEALLAQSGELSADQEITQEVKRRIVAALQDFEFTELRIDFMPERGDVVAAIFASGKGRPGPEAQEFAGLKINVHNFNILLNTIIREGPALKRAFEPEQPE